MSLSLMISSQTTDCLQSETDALPAKKAQIAIQKAGKGVVEGVRSRRSLRVL